MTSEKLLFCVVVVVAVFCNEASGSVLTNFNPELHHLLLVSESDPRVKRSLDFEVNLPENDHFPSIHDFEDDLDLDEEDDEVFDFLNETARIYACDIQTDIRYRYARTQVSSQVMNRNRRDASEVIFIMVLPEAAFISKFLMEVKGKVYTAYVKEKEEARNVYTDAQNRGLGAGLVEVNARHANVFNVNLNVKPSSKVTFNLTYEEFLIRKLGNYEQVIHIRPEQISEIPDFKISMTILESQNITRIQVPKLVTNEIPVHEDEGNRNAEIIQPTGNYAMITWRPSPSDQEMVKDEGIKFITRYDINHDSGAGEILLMNGYFVHFFAPSHVLPMRKHVVYVLDVSGSMNGRKMEQMKHVMSTVMDDLKPDDFFNIILFSSDSKVVMPSKPPGFAEPILATEFALREAHQLLSSLVASGATNIDAALRDALAITSRVKPTPQKEGIGTLPENVESLIMFLTDGDPTVGVTRTESIVASAKTRNLGKVPIYAISFGLEPDFGFLKKLSLENFGFARKIYEGGDADIQIRGFYKEISSPLLSNITFKYTTNSSGSSVKKLTKKQFPSIFTGSEIVVAGYLKDKKHRSSAPVASNLLTVDIDANGRNGRVTLSGDDLTRNAYDLLLSQNQSVTNQSLTFSPPDLEDGFLERLWAYITIKQLLEIPPGHNGTLIEDDYVYEDFGEGLEGEELNNKERGEEEEFQDKEEMQPMDDGELLPPMPMSLVSSSNETARDRALRLALKYGFVTPITSLVVVKPEEPSLLANSKQSNKTEVADVVNLEEATAQNKQSMHVFPRNHMGRPNHFSSGRMRGRSMPIPTNTYQAPPIFPGPPGLQGPPPPAMSLSFQQPQFFSVPNPTPNSKFFKQFANFEQRHAKAAIMSQPHALNFDNLRAVEPPAAARGTSRGRSSALSFHRGNYAAPSTTTQRPPSKNLLATIGWPILREPTGRHFLIVYGTKYHVLGDYDNLPPSSQNKCTGGSRHRRFQGTCQHLRDCVPHEIKNDFEKYVNSYFCGISLYNGLQYAGVCCNQ